MQKKSDIKPTTVRSERIALRISPEEFKMIKDFCQKHQVTISDFVRQSIKLVGRHLILDK